MKNLISQIVKACGTLVILGVSSLSAQALYKIVVDVPFGFTLESQHFPAGTYSLTSDTLQSPLLVRGEENGTAMFVLGFSAETSNVQERGKLVFHRYGDQYFLSKIWYGGTNQGRELRVSKVEQEVARNISKPGETTVLIAGSKQQKPVR